MDKSKYPISSNALFFEIQEADREIKENFEEYSSPLKIITPKNTNKPSFNNFENTKTDNYRKERNQADEINTKNLKIQLTWKNVTIFLENNCCGLFKEEKNKDELHKKLNPIINQTTANMNSPNLFTNYNLQNIHSQRSRQGISPNVEHNLQTNLSINLKKRSSDNKKYILNDISGTVLPGQFLTIIGASGAGKTTLLSYLSGKNLSSNLTHDGEVFVNDIPRNQLDYSSLIAFVQQDDILTEFMSVRENIFFACQLRTPGTKEEMNARCDEIINTMGLYHVQNQRIGGIMKKIISGGERKRTSIAIELVSRTPLIFLDEPTTGLDSVMATKITEALSKYSKNGNTIIATIHQPNSEMLKLFDQLMVLSQGKIVYFNKADYLVNYFKDFGKPKYICPERMNPAEFAMILISSETFTELTGEYSNRPVLSIEEANAKYNKRMTKLFMHYEQSKYKCNISIKGQDLSELSTENIYSVIHKADSFSQLKILYIRAITLLLRSFLPSLVRYFVVILLALLSIGVYYNISNVGPSSVTDRMGIFMIISMVDFVMSLNTAITLFPDERALFMREQISGLYDALPYYISKLFCEYPFIILDPIILRLILYWACHLRNETSIFFINLCSGFLVDLYGYAFALFLGIVIGKREAIYFSFSVVYVPLFLFSGQLADLSSLFPLVWILQWLSPFKYSVQILLRQELSGLMFEYNLMASGSARFVPGEALLDAYNMDLSVSTCFIALGSLFIGFTILGFIFIKIFVWRMKL